MRFDVIQFRKNYPETWRLILFLGSIQWAGILLTTIAVACAVATIMESKWSTNHAKNYIYHAPWFHVWLICLCINLFCVTITRLPWKRKHYGFVITHFGIIILLFGAMVGSWFGFEAFANLKKGEEPIFRLTQNESVMIVQSPKDQNFYSIPLPVETLKLSEKKPRIFTIPDSNLFLRVDAHSAQLDRVPKLVPSSEPGAAYGSILELSSPMAGQKSTFPFIAATAEPQITEFFQMARIVWVNDLVPFEKKMNQWSETQMVFEKIQPIISNTSGLFSGYLFRVESDENKALFISLKTPKGKQERIALGTKFPQKIDLGSSKIQATVNGYWPDFEIKEGRPSTKSNSPENPAILIRLEGKQSIDSRPYLVVAPLDDQNLRFSLIRNGASYAKGKLTVGVPVSTGWGPWMVEVKHIVVKSLLQYQIEPQAEPGPNLTPGVRVQLLDPEKKPLNEPKWILSGETETMAISSTQVIQLAFGLKTRPIDFGVQLNHFEVPRDEGSDTPAGFISTVWFYDSNRRVVREDHAEMNYPATYPGGFWRSVVGMNYKFSQASWNPENLGESTLQVLFDPGWPLKWIGSLMISFGIITMFYFKDSNKKNNPATKSV